MRAVGATPSSASVPSSTLFRVLCSSVGMETVGRESFGIIVYGYTWNRGFPYRFSPQSRSVTEWQNHVLGGGAMLACVAQAREERSTRV